MVKVGLLLPSEPSAGLCPGPAHFCHAHTRRRNRPYTQPKTTQRPGEEEKLKYFFFIKASAAFASPLFTNERPDDDADGWPRVPPVQHVVDVRVAVLVLAARPVVHQTEERVPIVRDDEFWLRNSFSTVWSGLGTSPDS